MEFIVVGDIKDLEQYKNKWNAILLKNNNNNPFVQYEWIDYWWRYLGKGHELFIIVISEGSQVIGFCPFMLTKKFMHIEVNFIGRSSTPYMDLVILNSFRKDAIEELLDYLVSIKRKYIFNIHGLAQNGADYRIMESYFSKNKRNFIACKLQSWYLDTSGGDFESFYRLRCAHNSVKNIAKYEKKLKKIGELTYKRLDENSLEGIYDIHNKRWYKKNDRSSFSKGQVKELFKRLALDSNLPFAAIADGLYIDDRLIAFRYGFLFNKRYICYRVAHDDLFAVYGPGKIIYKEKIKECLSKDIDICEFGTGRSDPHKAYWTDCAENINRIIFPCDNTISRLAFIKHSIYENLKNQLIKSLDTSSLKNHTLGEIKHILSMCTFGKIKAAVIASLSINSMKRLASKFKRFYYYRKRKVKFVIYEKALPDSIPKNYRQPYHMEYTVINEIEDIMEIMQLKPTEILRRLEKGKRCIKVLKGAEVLAWVWFDEAKLSTRVQQDILALENGCVCLYDLWITSNLKEQQRHQATVEALCYFLKDTGKKRLCIAVERHENLLIKVLDQMGFKKHAEEQL